MFGRLKFILLISSVSLFMGGLWISGEILSQLMLGISIFGLMYCLGCNHKTELEE
jgi:hypothetical protein